MTVEFTDALPYLLLWMALGASVFPDGPQSWGNPDSPLARRCSRRRDCRMGGTRGTRPLLGRVPDRRATSVPRGSPHTGVGHGSALGRGPSHSSDTVDPERSRPGFRVRFCFGPPTTRCTGTTTRDSRASCCMRCASSRSPGVEWKRAIVATVVVALLTMVAVGVPATATEFVSWDPKWPEILAVWLPANLFLTCVAEETFFRGLLQHHLRSALRGRVRAPALAALLVASVAFGVAHIAGGTTYVLLATLAGVGYGAAYHLTGTCGGQHPGALHP